MIIDYLWPLIPKEHVHEIQSTLTDFSNILVGTDKHAITPRDYNKLYKESVTFISNEVMSAKSFTATDIQQHVIVLSHFPPSAITFDHSEFSSIMKYVHSSFVICNYNISIETLVLLIWNMFWVLLLIWYKIFLFLLSLFSFLFLLLSFSPPLFYLLYSFTPLLLFHYLYIIIVDIWTY